MAHVAPMRVHTGSYPHMFDRERMEVSLGHSRQLFFPGYNGQTPRYGDQQLFKQHAHPVPQPLTASAWDRPNQHTLDSDVGQPEHMLRRKTPNGTLSAAYDGTAIGDSAKPSATKYIKLPLLGAEQRANASSIGPSSGSTQTPFVQNPFSLAKSLPTPYGKLHQIPPRVSVPNLAYSTLECNWPQDHRQQHQVDSVLNQIPTQSSSIYHQQALQHIPLANQLAFQAPLGLTALDHQPPWGPFWPNGAYVPYRPAAARDPLYYSSTSPNALVQHGPRFSPQHLPNQHLPVTQQRFGNHAIPADGHHYQQPCDNGFNCRPGGAILPAHYSLPPGSYGNLNGVLDPPQIPHHANAKPHLESAPAPGIAYRRVLSDCLSGGFMASATHAQPPFTLPKFESHAKALNYRERVLTWAHGVYVDLLASVQHGQKHTHQRRDVHGYASLWKDNIYPRPPRHPSSHSESSVRNGTELLEGHTNRRHATLDRHIGDTSGQTISHVRKSSRISQGRPASASQAGEMSFHDSEHLDQLSQIKHGSNEPNDQRPSSNGMDNSRALRQMAVSLVPPENSPAIEHSFVVASTCRALDLMTSLCCESQWQWIDGMLLSGCLAYGLGDHWNALEFYSKVLKVDPNHVEAISNLAATLLALDFTRDAEECWRRAISLRPSYFEAVEHLVGLLCGSHRAKEATELIDFIETSLRLCSDGSFTKAMDKGSGCSISSYRSQSLCASDASDTAHFEFDDTCQPSVASSSSSSTIPGFGSSGYAIPGSDNGRLLALVHAKGNLLYALGDSIGAAKAFENAVIIGVGRCTNGIRGLVNQVLSVVSDKGGDTGEHQSERSSTDPILLPPEMALRTAKLCFPRQGELPGLKDVASGMAKKAAIATTSNSLLSLAKIFQDGMSSTGASSNLLRATCGVREILALYYLSLALQPSPSTANNVGILLASVQQGVRSKSCISTSKTQGPTIPGVVPGSGIALALAYYNYGLNLDSRHAHLFTNLGSLLKDIGQLNAAIKTYEQAVACDGNFDIALANLANAVKDQGRISDAINYYKRAVRANPDFAEAVCGLANALNSVCSWNGRGGVAAEGGKRDRWHVDGHGMLLDAKLPGAVGTGWIKRVVEIVEKQLADGETWGFGVLHGSFLESLVDHVCLADEDSQWHDSKKEKIRTALSSWAGQKWEGAKIVRLVERAIKRLGWQWYHDKYIRRKPRAPASYMRPHIPSSLSVPGAPTVLPFHTFTCPVSAKQVRQISQRNGLRISCSTLRAPWLPQTVYCPPPPPKPQLNVGYVSSDFNNHPLAHLMQSVFGFHDQSRVKAVCYATATSDGSVHRQQIEKETPVFHDASSWPAERLVKQILDDKIHILVNLNGYTRGARNEVFAARPAPIQMSFMGFAGTLGAEWCDYLLADDTAVPPDTLRPWRRNVDLEDAVKDENCGGDQEGWVYGENIIYCRDTFFCCDHRQSAPDAKEKQCDWDEEQSRRWAMRKELFPGLSDDAIIFGNFNQLYKIEPTTFRTWLRILARVPKAILWLLRFPDLGEQNLKSTALLWAGPEVASRVLFTDVAPKHKHIERARICDLFLDTPECNAHTTAADVLWSGTPLLTLPRYRYKMCSRMAASILKGALPKTEAGERAAKELIAGSDEEYEERAVELGNELFYKSVDDEVGRGKGRLTELRKTLYESRWTSALFDTRRWVRDLEDAYEEVWRKWVAGEGGDIWLEELDKKGT